MRPTAGEACSFALPLRKAPSVPIGHRYPGIVCEVSPALDPTGLVESRPGDVAGLPTGLAPRLLTANGDFFIGFG